VVSTFDEFKLKGRHVNVEITKDQKVVVAEKVVAEAVIEGIENQENALIRVNLQIQEAENLVVDLA